VGYHQQVVLWWKVATVILNRGVVADIMPVIQLEPEWCVVALFHPFRAVVSTLQVIIKFYTPLLICSHEEGRSQMVDQKNQKL